MIGRRSNEENNKKLKHETTYQNKTCPRKRARFSAIRNRRRIIFAANNYIIYFSDSKLFHLGYDEMRQVQIYFSTASIIEHFITQISLITVKEAASNYY